MSRPRRRSCGWREHPGATLLALGPLTNLALAVALEPRLPELLGQTVLMGGAVRALGNASAVAEFNIYADAEAAAMVFARGLNPLVIGWELTLETPVLWPRWDAIVGAGAIGSRFVARTIEELMERTRRAPTPAFCCPTRWPWPLYSTPAAPRSTTRRSTSTLAGASRAA